MSASDCQNLADSLIRTIYFKKICPEIVFTYAFIWEGKRVPEQTLIGGVGSAMFLPEVYPTLETRNEEMNFTQCKLRKTDGISARLAACDSRSKVARMFSRLLPVLLAGVLLQAGVAKAQTHVIDTGGFTVTFVVTGTDPFGNQLTRLIDVPRAEYYAAVRQQMMYQAQAQFWQEFLQKQQRYAAIRKAKQEKRRQTIQRVQYKALKSNNNQ